MPDAPFDNLRLLLMQDFLPVGIGLVERVKKGGITEVAELFNTSDDPVNQLRTEGDSAASALRQKLDEISPGLGNPVMNVNVQVEDIEVTETIPFNETKLLPILERIEKRIDLLMDYLDD